MMTKNEVKLIIIIFITQQISPQNELTWKEPFRESFANSRQIYNLPQQSGKSSWNHGSAPKNPMRSPRAILPRNLYYGWSPQSLVYAIWWCAHLKIDVSLLLALALDSQFKVSTTEMSCFFHVQVCFALFFSFHVSNFTLFFSTRGSGVFSTARAHGSGQRRIMFIYQICWTFRFPSVKTLCKDQVNQHA